ncbi:MAG TPA: flagellar FlbD family protein [archaeon]|nr:flagellar FlbD family protein [archaeon]
MIEVTKLNGGEMVINAELIETVEATPDTIVCLTTGKKYMVRETVKEIIARVIAYRRQASLLVEKLEVSARKNPET